MPCKRRTSPTPSNFSDCDVILLPLLFDIMLVFSAFLFFFFPFSLHLVFPVLIYLSLAV